MEQPCLQRLPLFPESHFLDQPSAWQVTDRPVRRCFAHVLSFR